MEFNYVEFAESLFSRNKIVKIDKPLATLSLKKDTTGFVSLYYYTENIINYINKNNTVSGYNGEVFSDFIIFDFDCENDLNKSFDEAKKLYSILSEIKENRLKLFFSGGKGFHLVWYIPEIKALLKDKEKYINFHLIHKRIAERLKNRYNIQTLDLCIYKKNGLIRLINSKNKIGYKIEIKKEEFNCDIEQIKKLSKTQRKTESFEYDYSKEIEEYLNEYVECYKENGIAKIDINNIQQGNRNNNIFSLCNYLFSHGIDRELVENIIYSINQTIKDPLSEREITTIINSAFRYHKDDNLDIEKYVHNIEDAAKNFIDIEEKTINFNLGDRYKNLTETLKNCVPGDLIGIVATSGVGKTTICLDFMNELCKNTSTNGVFFTLEMGLNACFLRCATITSSLDKKYVNYRGNINTSMLRTELKTKDTILNYTIENWKNLLFVDKLDITIKEINDFIQHIKAKYPISCFGIDYLQLVNNMSDIKLAGKTARSIKTIAKQNELYGFLAIQCNKLATDATEEIKDNMVEGVMAIKQTLDYMLGFWRDNKNKRRLLGKYMKARWGCENPAFEMIRNGLLYNSNDIVENEINNYNNTNEIIDDIPF